LGDFKDKEGATMAEFFNKEYAHAYPRNNTVWIKGTVNFNPYSRISTGKPFSKANMNWAEKNWQQLLMHHYEKKQNQMERSKMPTLNEYAESSFIQQKSNRRFYTTDSHLRKYEMYIAPHFGTMQLDEIRVSDIKKWYNILINEINTHKYASDIRSVFSVILCDAIEDEYIDKNVVKNARFPKKVKFKNKGSEEVLPFTLDEVMTMIKESQGQFRNIITFQFFTGSRPGEMIALKWEDINFHSKKIHIRRTRQTVPNPDTGINELGPTKTGYERKIDMLPIVEEALREQYLLTGLKGGFVFVTMQGNPYMDTDGLRKRQWRNLLKRCLIDDRIFYQTRHTFASIFLSKGEDLAWISRVMLGHTTIATTLKYYAKFIKQKDVVRGAFLLNERTNNVQDKSKLSQIS